MTCKDCIHYNTCVIVEHRVDENEDHLSEFGCEDFINKNDVVEVVHGEWAKNGWNNYTCSNCGHQYVGHGASDWKHCPDCGAKMDKKKIE